MRNHNLNGRRDPKSKAIIFDPSPESQRINRLVNIVKTLIEDPLVVVSAERKQNLLKELEKV